MAWESFLPIAQRARGSIGLSHRCMGTGKPLKGSISFWRAPPSLSSSRENLHPKNGRLWWVFPEGVFKVENSWGSWLEIKKTSSLAVLPTSQLHEIANKKPSCHKTVWTYLPPVHIYSQARWWSAEVSAPSACLLNTRTSWLCTAKPTTEIIHSTNQLHSLLNCLWMCTWTVLCGLCLLRCKSFIQSVLRIPEDHNRTLVSVCCYSKVL